MPEVELQCKSEECTGTCVDDRGTPVEIRELDPRKLKLDSGLQMRARMNDLTIGDYADGMLAGNKFPPVRVFYDGKLFWLADGWQRVNAALMVDRKILCSISPGGFDEAFEYAVGSNVEHGDRRSPSDAKRCVELTLNQDKHARKPNAEIARMCRVDPGTVEAIRLTVENPRARSRIREITRNGKTFTKVMPEPKPIALAVREMPSPDPTHQKTAITARRHFLNMLAAKGIEVFEEHKSPVLEIPIVLTATAVHIVESELTLPILKDAILHAMFARQEIDPQHKLRAVVVGRVQPGTEDWIAKAKELGVKFLELS